MKKVFCAILSLSLILLPCSVFADTASGSAISLDDRLKLAELSGVATPSSAIQLAATAAAQDVFITGFTSLSGGTPYYFYTGSTVNSNFISQPSLLGGLATGITQSIANSAQGLASKITDYSSVLSTISTRLSNISGYVDGLETAMSTNNNRLQSIINKSVATPTDVSTAASNIVSAIQNQSFTVPQQLLDDVSSIESNTTTESDRWSWASTFNANFTIPRYRQNGEGGSGSDLSQNPTVRSLPNQIWWWLSTMNTSMVYAFRDLTSGVGTANTQTYLDKDLNPVSMGRTSFWRDFRNIGGNINDLVARLAFVLANDEDIEARQAAQANAQAVVDDFIKPSGIGAASASDFGSLADIASSGSDSLSSGVAPSVLLNQLGGDGDGWAWFSQQIQDELSAPSGRSSLRSDSKSNSSDTPYLDAYYRDLEEKIGFKLW